uniref:Uncharacterized protein n=1 Tax=Ananas comosus var. bracteatus TaxID=296719 RepID=A0A6V7QLP4_ANACO|nr:unnamed protein product [Ananas comosus var. bracteatus]
MKILPGFLSAKRSLNPFRSNRSAQQQQLQSCRNPDENESQISCQERSDDVPHRPTPAAVMHVPVDEPLGVEKNLEKIQNLLSDLEVSLIGVAGVGGVGKTTLLKALNNSFLEQRHDFDAVIFASAFYGGERGLQAAIARRLGLPWEESRSKMANAVRISVALKRRRFLLLIDDIVNPVDLEELGVPPKGPRSKSKVVVAARSEQICRSMGVLPEHVINVGPMEPCMAWQLFLRHVGTEAPQPCIMDIAKRVAGECGGFPLGLRAVGHAMSTARTIDEWFQSLEALKRSKDDLEKEGKARETLSCDIEPAVLSTLKFCYKKLRPEKLRAGISYCALFPKNHSIRKDDLICYWIGEGILEGVHNEGESLVDKLKSFGMLKEGADPEQEVGMDDILRDLILQMKKGEFIAEAGRVLTGTQSSHHFEVAKKVSLMHNDVTEIEQLLRPSELASLNLRSNNRLRKLPDDFFGMTTYLRLLDLSHTGIRETPRGISRLAFLRHLDLSFTKIKSLPEEIGEIRSLVQLILEGTTSLATIPPGIFPKLIKMAKLNLYCSYSDWELKDGKDVAGENEGRVSTS